MSNDNENKELFTLININKDAVEFYESAQKTAKNPQIEATFRSLESLHLDVMTNLKQIATSNGATVDADQTLVGEVRQFFGELHAKVSNDVDETLVSHLEEAEDRCLHSMQDAMDSDDVSPSTKVVLTRELSALRKSHDYMKALKDSMKDAA